MPTLSTTASFTFANVGPLTTTYTAPSTCFTQPTTGLYIGLHPFQLGRADNDRCETTTAATIAAWTAEKNCVPHGEAFVDAMFGQTAYPYYSPAFACPPTWSTVGVAEKDDGGNVTRSGMFANPTDIFNSLFFTVTATKTRPVSYDPVPNEFVNVMDNGETAIACCPSDYTMASLSLCYSTMPFSAYTKSIACSTHGMVRVHRTDRSTTRTFNYYGTTVTATLDIAPSTPDVVSVYTVTFNDTDRARLTQEGAFVFVYADMLTLVHHADDVANTGSGAGAGNAQPTETDNAAAATAGGASKGTWVAVATILGVWGLGMVAGASVIMSL